MEILRVFNNNVVLARNDVGQEVVLTGRGLGFQKKAGQPVEAAKVIRTFVPDEGRNPDNFGQLLAAIPPEHLDLAARSLETVRDDLGSLPSSTVVALADHLSFAIKRARTGLEVDYPLRAEVVHLYPREVELAERVVARINAEVDTPLPDDEALPIALHLVNASFNTGDLSKTYQMTGVFSQIFDVVESSIGRPLDRDSANAARFITHLRYFFVRAHDAAQLDDAIDPLAASLAASFPDATRSAHAVAAILALRLGTTVSASETTYLAMHIARLTSDERVRTAPQETP
ncbi:MULTISPECIES: PRD domain-containing protein [unclassified Luteococcus]|uniref:PRD domain-containing protein n=1 Tax=unclassified Luteococcus TaxID=2639923 RepID=UPI00313B9526